MSNDDVGLSMIAVLGLQRSKIHTRPIIMTIGTSQMLLMPSFPTRDPEVPATPAMEGVPHSWVEKRLSKIGNAREHHPMSKDLAIGLATSVSFLNAVTESCTVVLSLSLPPVASLCSRKIDCWCVSLKEKKTISVV